MPKKELIRLLKKENLFGRINNLMNDFIRKILLNSTTIAIYGASANEYKDSYRVMKYLQVNGYKVLPINPYTPEKLILGELVYKNINDIKIPINILNIFRPSSEVFEITQIALKKKIKTVWLQLEIICKDTENLLNKYKINLIQNKCIKIEHQKLYFISNLV